MSTYEDTVGACRALLGALDAERRDAAQWPFEAEGVRRDWAYIPRTRRGLALGDMTRGQRRLAHRLLATGLSRHAYAQAATIMALEDVLDHIEGGGRDRHGTDYWTTLFGDPADDVWGWRFEGHHVSVNVTVVDRAVSISPCFLGANPAVVAHRDTAVVRPLGEEEDLARALLAAMEPRRRAAAVVADTAPADIRTESLARLPDLPAPAGVPRADLAGTAAELLDRLVGVYLDRLPSDLAAERAVRLGEVWFAWEGPPEPGRGHYYQIRDSTDDLLIEYDNTQNSANHIHSVCRSGSADFGEDLLARHYAEHPH